MKKRILALLMASVLTLQLAGCNTKDAGTAGKETQSSIKDQFNSAREERENAGDTASEQDTQTPESDAGRQDADDEGTEVRYQDDYYEFVNQNLLSKIELAATDAHWDWR